MTETILQREYVIGVMPIAVAGRHMAPTVDPAVRPIDHLKLSVFVDEET